MYNSMLQMVSIGLHDVSLPPPANFRIQGGIYHLIGPLTPEDGQQPRFAQIYCVDPAQQVEHRLAAVPNTAVERNILESLQEMLHAVNPFVRQFAAVASSNHTTNVRLIFRPAGLDRRRYNVPVTGEVGVLMVGDGEKRFDQLICVCNPLLAAGAAFTCIHMHCLTCMQAPILITLIDAMFTIVHNR